MDRAMLAVGLLASAIAGRAWAGPACDIGPDLGFCRYWADIDGNGTVELPRFNPQLGWLRGTEIRVTGPATFTLALTNVGAEPIVDADVRFGFYRLYDVNLFKPKIEAGYSLRFLRAGIEQTHVAALQPGGSTAVEGPSDAFVITSRDYAADARFVGEGNFPIYVDQIDDWLFTEPNIVASNLRIDGPVSIRIEYGFDPAGGTVDPVPGPARGPVAEPGVLALFGLAGWGLAAARCPRRG